MSVSYSVEKDRTAPANILFLFLIVDTRVSFIPFFSIKMFMIPIYCMYDNIFGFDNRMDLLSWDRCVEENFG